MNELHDKLISTLDVIEGKVDALCAYEEARRADAEWAPVYDIPLDVKGLKYGDLRLVRKLILEAAIAEDRAYVSRVYDRVIKALDRTEAEQINGEFV